MSLASSQNSWLSPAIVSPTKVNVDSLTVRGVPITGLQQSGIATASASAPLKVPLITGLTPVISFSNLYISTNAGITTLYDSFIVGEDGTFEYKFPVPFDFGTQPSYQIVNQDGGVEPIITSIDNLSISGVGRLGTGGFRMNIMLVGNTTQAELLIDEIKPLPGYALLNYTFTQSQLVGPTYYPYQGTPMLHLVNPIPITLPSDIDISRVVAINSCYTMTSINNVGAPANSGYSNYFEFFASTSASSTYNNFQSRQNQFPARPITTDMATPGGFASTAWNQYQPLYVLLQSLDPLYLYGGLLNNYSTQYNQPFLYYNTNYHPDIKFQFAFPSLTYYTLPTPLAPSVQRTFQITQRLH